jgi:hypothetical protein
MEDKGEEIGMAGKDRGDGKERGKRGRKREGQAS